jgi:hypothetical protein
MAQSCRFSRLRTVAGVMHIGDPTGQPLNVKRAAREWGTVARRQREDETGDSG